MMTLDEAISHCKEVAQSKTTCANEHKQLVLWLTELKARRSFFRCYVEACENNTGGGCRRDYIEIEECGICGKCGEVVPLCKQYEAYVSDMECGDMECGDCISREDALMALTGEWTESRDEILSKAIRRIKKLPPVTPVRKKGHWREVYAETNYRNGWIEFSCEACEHQHGLESGEYGWSYGEPIPWKFCPICGAEMDGAESEVTRNED